VCLPVSLTTSMPRSSRSQNAPSVTISSILAGMVLVVAVLGLVIGSARKDAGPQSADNYNGNVTLGATRSSGMFPGIFAASTDVGHELDDWDVQRVTAWVDALGPPLSQYAPLFQAEEIDGKLFSTLDDAGLKELGVQKGFHRKFFSKQIAASHSLSPEFINLTPYDFYEFRGANRKLTDVAMQASFYCPRLLMLYAEFYQSDILKDVFFDTEDFGLGFRLSSLFAPHLQMAYYVYPHAADYRWPAWSFIVAQLCTFITEVTLVLGIHQGAKRAWADDFLAERTQEQVREIFDGIDSNGDGVLNMTEVMRALRKKEDNKVAELLGLPPGIPKQGSKEQAVFTLLFQKIATANGSDNDKEITWNEFKAYFLPESESAARKLNKAFRPTLGVVGNIRREAYGAVCVFVLFLLYPVTPWFVCSLASYWLFYMMGVIMIIRTFVDKDTRIW